MLVITRKLNEAIIIGDGIKISVLRVGKDGVRLGVDAPRNVAVHREEIYKLVCDANVSAAAPTEVRALAGRLRERLPARQDG